MVLVQREIKKVYKGSTEVRPCLPRTFTVSWTEVQTPTSWTNTYSDDASWMTQWSTAFDDFFWYEAVAMADDWTIAAILPQKWWVFSSSLTTFANSYSGYNIMIRFPKRWIKMTKSWTTVTLSITEEADKSWYQYYAFNDHWVAQDYLYLWAFKASISNSKLKSVVWDNPWNLSLSSAVNAANAHWWGYHFHVVSWYARQYINALYKMKRANPDSQTAVWMWLVDTSSAYHITWWSWSESWNNNATWWESTWTKQMRLFWLEDRWWNVEEWMDWAYFSSSGNLKTSKSWAFSSSSRITTFDTDTTVVSSWWYIMSITWTNDWMFACNWRILNTPSYYSDTFSTYSGEYLWAGGRCGSGSGYATAKGAFYITSGGATLSMWYTGSRLMYL